MINPYSLYKFKNFSLILNLKRLYSLVLLAPWYSYCFLNNIIVLITQSHLSIAQISSSFKWLDMHTSTSTTPTLSAPSCYFTTAVLNDCYSEVTAYTALAYSYWASFTTRMDAYVTPTNNTDYSCHIKPIELV